MSINEHETQNKTVKSSFDLLKDRNFFAIFMGGFISDIGTYFTLIAMIFLVLDISTGLNMSEAEATQALVIAFVIQLIPSLIIGPFAGVIADNYDRKKIMIFTDIIRAITSFCFILITSLTGIYAIILVAAVIRLFFGPARGASIPRIVGHENLVRANGWIQTTRQLSTIIGPALAGIIIVIFGLKIAFIIDAISFIVSAILIMTVKLDLKPQKSKEMLTPKKIVTNMYDGLKITFKDKVLAFLFVMFGIVLFGVGMIDPLFAAYLSFEFGLGEDAFGIIISLSAISGLIGAIIITTRNQLQRKLTLILLGVLISGVAIGILGIAPFFHYPIILLFLGMIIVGLINVMIGIPLSSLMQGIVKDEHLGKVGGFLESIIAFSHITGAAVASVIVLYIDINQLFIITSIFLIFVTIVGYIILKLFKLEELAQQRENIMRNERKKRKELLANEEILKMTNADQHNNNVVPGVS
ncbi:MAG: MFS transporter [Candidatus Hodarchaeales archaeon]|jgi:MFS family permease